MARKNPVRDAVVADIKNRQRAVGKKLSRLKSQGINTSGLDPRRDLHGLSELSLGQLRAYHRTLATFASRETSYVKGVRGQALPGGRFRELKRLEREFNARARGYEASVGHLHVPGAGRTIEARLHDLEAEKFRAGGQRRAFESFNRQAKNINGSAALEDLIKQMKGMLSPAYLNKRMKTQRENLEVMLTSTGDRDVLAKINKLTNNQLNVLIDYTYFMTAVGGRYAFAKALNVDTPQWQAEENEDNAERIRDLIDWAATLPRRADQNKASEYTNTNAGPINLPGKGYTNTNAGPIRTRSSREYTDTNAKPIPTQRRGKRNRGDK